ncbi:MAG: class I SAM-dependent methyltransferase [Thermoplasmata archaeon]
MNAVSRFFVNLSATRRAVRNCRWIGREVTVPADARCLEIGCGNGAFARRFVGAFRPALYVATDFDPRQIEAAMRPDSRTPVPTPAGALLFRTADVRELPFPVASFEVALAFLAIHHASPSHGDFSGVPPALTELDRVLQPGGQLVYEEFLHKQGIRAWLGAHGYVLERVRRRWRLEWIAARKPNGGPSPSSTDGR